MKRIPVIDFTDLYHPYQDPGDNFDILAPYAMPEIDLKAVILDITQRFRQTPAERPSIDPNLYPADPGARDPGFIPITQCNFIFDRIVPAAVTPFEPLRSPEDAALDAPVFQQQGISLFLDTLRASAVQIDVVVFCSCRGLAIALNREPTLLRDKVRRLHLSIGTSTAEIFDVDWSKQAGVPVRPGSKGFIEWNVALDPHAFVRVLNSGLPMSLYPCASENGPFSMGRHNTFYRLNQLNWITEMTPRLRNYLGYAFTRSNRSDFLRAMDGPLPEDAKDFFTKAREHAVWETAIWLEVTGRKLVKKADGSFRIVRPEERTPADTDIPGRQRYCQVTAVNPTGRFAFRLIDEQSCITIFDRGDDHNTYQLAMNQAVPLWYQSFQVPAKTSWEL